MTDSIPTVKHGGSNIKLGDSFPAAGTGEFVRTEELYTDQRTYRGILKGKSSSKAFITSDWDKDSFEAHNQNNTGVTLGL